MPAFVCAIGVTLGMISQMADIPEAGMPPQPIPYAGASAAADMRWIVRFVGVFVACQLCVQFLPIPYFWFAQASFGAQLREPSAIVFVSGAVAGIVAAMGIFYQRRIGLALLVLLMLAHPIGLVAMVPGAQRWAILPGYLVRSFGQLALLIAIWRRAERQGVLLPPRPAVVPNPAASNDMDWFLPVVGCYILLPLLTFAADTVTRLAMQQSVFGVQPYLLPSVAIALAFLRVPIAVQLLRRRPGALLWAAALFPGSTLVFQLVSIAQSGLSLRYLGQSLLIQWPEQLLQCALACALYLHARRFGFERR